MDKLISHLEENISLPWQKKHKKC